MNKKAVNATGGGDNKISREQAISMIFVCGFSNIVFTFTRTVNVTGKPFWLAILAGVLLNIPFGIWIFSFGRRQQGKMYSILLKVALAESRAVLLRYRMFYLILLLWYVY